MERLCSHECYPEEACIRESSSGSGPYRRGPWPEVCVRSSVFFGSMERLRWHGRYVEGAWIYVPEGRLRLGLYY
jgi:hypothetical protein